MQIRSAWGVQLPHRIPEVSEHPSALLTPNVQIRKPLFEIEHSARAAKSSQCFGVSSYAGACSTAASPLESIY